MRFVDLSIPIANDTLCDPPLTTPKVRYSGHENGAKEMAAFFPGLKPEDHLPDGKGWAVEEVTLSTHSGTHMDAPWHFSPVQDREIESNRDAKTIDEFPLEWGIGPLIVLDCTDMQDGYVMTPEDLNKKLDDIGHRLREGDVLCIHTSASEHFGTSSYINSGIGVGRDATLQIVRSGVHVVGTDAWSWDAPFSITAKKWRDSVKKGKPDPSMIWEGHFAGIELGYFQMEKLTNLDKVPAVGATIYNFPIKIKDASAGWVRAVAMVPE